MIRVLVALLVAFALLGCQAGGQAEKGSEPVNKPVEETPAEKLHGQLSSGSYQLGAVLELLEQLHDGIQPLLEQPASRDALKDMADIVDQVGRSLDEAHQDPPLSSAIEGEFAGYDEQRLASITACNDALHDINEAQGILMSLQGDLPESLKTKADELNTLFTATIDGLIAAVEAYGGQVEND